MKLGGYAHINGITFFCDVLKIRAIKRKKTIEYQGDWIVPKRWLRKLEGKLFLNGLLTMYYQWKIINTKHKLLIGGLLLVAVVEELCSFPLMDKIFMLTIDKIWVYSIMAAVLLLNVRRIIRLFQYHGAEHKTINCYMKYGYVNYYLVKKASRFNKRCGSNLALTIILIYGLLWIFGIDSFFVFLLVFLVSIQITKKLASIEGKWDKYMNILQWITVLEPKEEDIHLAINAFQRLQQAYEIYRKEVCT
ncbi:DUF1385 domain-containing protein [Natronincola ferrireducens]|uniref:Metal-dependent enzyme n=1 Tax=Natronincola ferrireducens TaxID=393762 RepID=A0A1G8ZHX9_9FIRM|nr:DUF1385 domain-containing protein [Natronincola ferrireducens]SDK14657.1 Protein of unknown function [Natronincola ferrireducens]